MIDNMSAKQLRELRDRIDAVIVKKQEEARVTLRERMAELAAKSGYSLQEIVGKVGKQKRPRRQMRDTKTMVIYSGFGRRPKNFDIKRAVPL